ncbi:MAG: type II toxin-antitoxin system death-on-curing family toxin [Alphaproteobacteria bacterium]|nr:type II toxin-antitoxin system death-on-curing family toxin [Alphaproteobacteria bacterium]MCW5742748.1 type II toxin-antitoxin system death-on-curing family toxin [Alphaproteobacteria bacterium]
MTRPSRIWQWLPLRAVLAMHVEQIAEHGGSSGTRDQGLLESALARPQHLATYGGPDAADLAAAYAFGIARNHPFVDGNKRTAFTAAYAFLAHNGFDLNATEVDAALVFTELAAGRLDEPTLAAWYRRHLAEG